MENLKKFAYWFFDDKKTVSKIYKIRDIVDEYEKTNPKLTMEEFLIAQCIADAATYYQEEQLSQIRKIANEGIVFCG